MLILLAFLASCEIINPAESIPAYVYIPKINFDAQTGQGTDSVEITDAWVFVNDDQIGVFELPAMVPILNKGINRLTISPGIILNKIANSRGINPFYKSFDMAIDFQPQNIDTIIPTSSFQDFTTFAWLEDFELAGHTLDSAVVSTSNFFKVDADSEPQNVYEGDKSIGFMVSPDQSRFTGQTSQGFVLPQNRRAVLLEMHYKSDYIFSVNLLIQTTDNSIINQSHLTLRKTDGEWKKAYVNFTNKLNNYEAGTRIWVVFDCLFTENQGSGNVYMDNFKLTY